MDKVPIDKQTHERIESIFNDVVMRICKNTPSCNRAREGCEVVAGVIGAIESLLDVSIDAHDPDSRRGTGAHCYRVRSMYRSMARETLLDVIPPQMLKRASDE